MQTNVLLPQVELTMDQVLVSTWLVNIGEKVELDQPLLEVETQKAVSEVPAPCQGYVRKLFVKPGDLIGEKALLCVLTDTADEDYIDPTNVSALANEPQATLPTALSSESSDGPVGSIKATPAARRSAKELGVDLSALTGTGPGGRITEADVSAFKVGSSSAANTHSGEWTPLSGARLALIEQMQKSLAEIPQIHLSRQLDVTPLSARSEGITFTHRLVVALAQALRVHPSLRTVIVDGKTKVEPVSVAVAMDTPFGLVAPAVRQADQMSLPDISRTIQSFRERAQCNCLQRQDLINAPFAVTNLGMFGVDFFNAFVFHGQTSVLSVGRMTETGKGTKTAWFGLAADHRVVDGVEGARFLQTLQSEILKA